MSPITRETLAARIATLEADSNISIKEGFYLQTMRLLLAEMDKPAPHYNGMMQLSNELASAKEALRCLSAFARSHAGDIQYTGDHPIAVAEKLAGRELYGNSEQLDEVGSWNNHMNTPTAQAGNYPVTPDGWVMVPKEMTPEMMRAVQIGSELGSYAAANLSGAYGLFAEFWGVACRAAGNSPVIPVGSDVEHVAAVLELIGSFDAADIEGDTVDLRFEVDGVDTGADASITEYAARGASIIRKLAGAQEVKS